MTCNCKTEIEAKLLERFKNLSPEAKSHEVELTGYALVIQDNAIVSKGCMDISTKAEFLVKKSGSFKLKKASGGNMVFTFCPFCGKRYDEPAAEAKQEGN